MTQIASRKKTSWLERLGSSFGKSQRLEREKARLEAFLTAFPGEYCGWSKDGSVAYSQGFCDILGLDQIKTITDIQSCLTLGDAAALEGVYNRLRTNRTSFIITVFNQDETKTLRISGSQGCNLDGQDTINVLWIEDITKTTKEQAKHIKNIANKKQELSQLKHILDTVPRPLWLRDENQKLTWCNATYADFLGKTKKEIITDQKEIFRQIRRKKGASKQRILPGATLAAKALKENKPKEAYAHSIIKGNRMLLRISEIPLIKAKTTLGFAFNITREEELETELKRYRSSNRELLEQLRSAIAIYTTDEKLEFYNTAFAQLWGLEDQWLNTNPKLGEIMEKLRETRRLPEQADFRHYKQNWLNMFTMLDQHENMLYLPDGTALRMLVVPHSMGGIMMTFEDVTSRLELESSYNTLIAVQKETLDNLAEAVVAYGGDGRIKLWNPAFNRLWNLNPEDLEGNPHITSIIEKMKPFFSKEEWPKQKEALIARGLDRVMHEGRLSRTDEILVDCVTVPLPDGGVLITYSDVTNKVQVENALREKAEALETAEQLKVDFLANVSYQLRTPLNALLGFNEILDLEYFGSLNKRQKEYTHSIRLAGDRLIKLIDDILDLSTLEAGYMTLQCTEFGLYKMLYNVFDLIEDWARKENIKLYLKCPKNIGKITADKRRLQQIIINLIRNAIAFTPSGGTITVTARRTKKDIQISVNDTGIGIAEEDHKRIFKPFERAQRGNNNTRILRGGAGLGLSLVKNITALHGGTVELESEPGKNTNITIHLPFTSEETKLKLPIKAS